MVPDIDPIRGMSSTVCCDFLAAAWPQDFLPFFFLKTMIDFSEDWNWGYTMNVFQNLVLSGV